MTASAAATYSSSLRRFLQFASKLTHLPISCPRFSAWMVAGLSSHSDRDRNLHKTNIQPPKSALPSPDIDTRGNMSRWLPCKGELPFPPGVSETENHGDSRLPTAAAEPKVLLCPPGCIETAKSIIPPCRDSGGQSVLAPPALPMARHPDCGYSSTSSVPRISL